MSADPPRNGEGDRGAKRRGGGAHHPHVPPIVETARKQRRQMSYPEVLQWQRLRGGPARLRFRRQHAIGLDYVADCYCASARLVIDRQIHEQPDAIAYDAGRDEFMRQRGLTVVRVRASDTRRNADEVAAAIVALASQPLHHRAAPGGPPPQQAGEDHR